MKLRGLTFDNDSRPEMVLVEMTIEEAAYIVKFAGSQNGRDSNALMSNSAGAKSEIYGCLVGYVFNAYWDEGISDYLRERAK